MNLAQCHSNANERKAGLFLSAVDVDVVVLVAAVLLFSHTLACSLILARRPIGYPLA